MIVLENFSIFFKEWIAVIITLLGFIIAFWQFKLYRKEIRDKSFIEFRQRFKSNVINIKVLSFILDNYGTVEELSEYEIFHFLGFYEELHKLNNRKTIRFR